MRIGIDCEFSFDADNEFVCICAAYITQMLRLFVYCKRI